MFLNPVGTAGYDPLFVAMAAEFKRPGTEIHVASLPVADGAFSHIEYRAYEGVVTRGILRATRAAAA